jgi:glycine hydroxymethyltransferase
MQRDKQIFDLILEEQERQIHGLELIASENFNDDNGSSWFCFDQ